MPPWHMGGLLIKQAESAERQSFVLAEDTAAMVRVSMAHAVLCLLCCIWLYSPGKLNFL